MSWTEERIELLTRLWGEGRSASQIAAELGGVTRNAVIGKVHRLKLDNRPKTGSDDGMADLAPAMVAAAAAMPAEPAPIPVAVAPAPVIAAVEAPAPRREVTPPPAPQPVPAPAPRILTPAMPASPPPPRAPMPQRQPMIHSVMGATALKMDPERDAFEDAQPFAHSEGGEVVPMSRNLTLVQLSERTCKWPLGDPLSPDFRFCGNHSQDSSPYCKHHARIAFQPVSERRRVR